VLGEVVNFIIMRSNSRRTTRRQDGSKLIVAAFMFCSFGLFKMSTLQLQYDYFDGSAMEITAAANAGKINLYCR
jgi:hypothetical protein